MEHIALIGREKIHATFQSKSLKGKDHMDEVSVDGGCY
jgi:hypothetical protein